MPIIEKILTDANNDTFASQWYGADTDPGTALVPISGIYDPSADALVDFSASTGTYPQRPPSAVQGIISTAMTGTTSTAVAGIGEPGASLHNYVCTAVVSNMDADTPTNVLLQDGNGGTTFGIVPAAALGGGAAFTFDPPLKQPTANTALYAANETTGASTTITITGYTGA